MRDILLSWIGHTDLKAAGLMAKQRGEDPGLGPVAQAMTMRRWDNALLLTNGPRKTGMDYVAWLQSHTDTTIHLSDVRLSSPMNFEEIYEAAVQAIARAVKLLGEEANRTYHLSPGTTAMAAVWIILGKTLYPAELIQTSKEHGLEVAKVPFDLTAEYIPELLRPADERLARLAAGLPPESPEIQAILHSSAIMKKVIAQARRAAVRAVPILLEGETGTGKELFARAIHAESTRRGKPFRAVNCGALTETLLESELFGHVAGAFTDARQAKKGLFEAADGGTLLLDEIAEMSPSMQVKLLRTLQEGKVRPVGGTQEIPVDVRIVAATNRNLIEEVRERRFRADLFYRLAVARLALPPLRERVGDVRLLLDAKLAEINEQSRLDPGFEPKTLTAGARQVLLNHPWPGNVRELVNTIQRLVTWAPGAKVTAEDAREALLPPLAATDRPVLGRPLTEGFDLRAVIADVARHYLERALAESGGVKSRAASLLGFPNHTTFSNWFKKYSGPSS